MDSSSTNAGTDSWNDEDDESTKVVAGTELWKLVEEEWMLVGAGSSSKVEGDSWNVPELWKFVDGEEGKVCCCDGTGPDENEVEEEDDPEEPPK